MSTTFQRWLQDNLQHRRMSQRQVAHFAGVDHSSVSRLLKGGQEPTLETAIRLRKALRAGCVCEPTLLAEEAA